MRRERSFVAGPPDVGTYACFLFCSIQNHAELQERSKMVMSQAIQIYQQCLRKLLNKSGYDMGSEGDMSMYVFQNPNHALHFALSLQTLLLELAWPDTLDKDIDILMSSRHEETLAMEEATNFLLIEDEMKYERTTSVQIGTATKTKSWHGLRVKVALHCGEVTSRQESNGRMVYSGTVVDETKSILNAITSGGQVVCSDEVLSMAFEEPLADASLLHLGRCKLHTNGGNDSGREIDLVSLSPNVLAKRQTQFLPLHGVPAVTPPAYLCPRALPNTTLVFYSLTNLKLTETQLLKRTSRTAQASAALLHSSVSELNLVNKLVLPTFKEVSESSIWEHGGYIAEKQAGFYLLAFHTPAKAINWAIHCQRKLMGAEWKPLVLQTDSCCEIGMAQGGSNNIFRGPRVKMGISWGDLQAVSLHSKSGRAAYYGPTVNLAARVEAAASGGQVLISTPSEPAQVKTVKAMIETEVPNCSVVDLGSVQLKGISGMKQILQVALIELSTRPFPKSLSLDEPYPMDDIRVNLDMNNDVSSCTSLKLVG